MTTCAREEMLLANRVQACPDARRTAAQPWRHTMALAAEPAAADDSPAAQVSHTPTDAEAGWYRPVPGGQRPM
jgi:hypothetical protein